MSAVPPATEHVGSEASPIVANGVIYINTPSGGLIAVDGATGTAKWKYQPVAPAAAGAAGGGGGGGGNQRGAAYGEGQVFTSNAGKLVALDANTGQEIWAVQPKAQDGTTVTPGAATMMYYDGMVYFNGGGRFSAAAVKASDGSFVWGFSGIAQPGTVVTDVNGVTTDAGASWGDCAQRGGGTAWVGNAIDPELGMLYLTIDNARGCAEGGGAQDGSNRPGKNLFANSLIALDVKTGAYKWHFQSVHHDIWDMDNVCAPVLADVVINGQPRKAIYYGGKSAHMYVLDRATGKELLPAPETPVIQDSRQKSWATQPVAYRPLPNCIVWQALDPKNVPGDPFRGVPNFNGYQPDATGKLAYNPTNYLEPDKPFIEYTAGKDHREGCFFDPSWDLPVLSTTSQNGGPTWPTYSYSQKLGLLYFPYGVSMVAHWRDAGSNGERAVGQYQSGGILALDAATNTTKWMLPQTTDMGHGQNPLSTAGDLVFVGKVDGVFLALDAATGKILWQFQTGADINSGPVTYTINGEQYVAVATGGANLPYGNTITRGSDLWAFKLGGTFKNPSGSSEAPVPPPINIRRAVAGQPVEGSTVNNTVLLARDSRTDDTAAAADQGDSNSMNPTHMRGPVGTTVTFRNPGAETFPNFPNKKMHCATQFFEGLFNPKLQPGQTFTYTFDKAGEYFFNDCTDPRPTGKVVVYDVPIDMPGAATFAGNALDLRSPNGVFTGVTGTVTARFAVPAGYTFEGDATMTAPLSKTVIPAASARAEAGAVVIQFNKADIDNNMPAGESVPLVIAAHFRQNGAQKQLTSTANVRVTK
jgi:outer membrane protein assembly factor BamB